MKRFATHLVEATELKNTHIVHLEDSLLDGASGATFALNVLKELGDLLATGDASSALHLSVKWDGSPSVVFGPDPASGKGFFVATKSAFNRTPRLAHSHVEVAALYPAPIRPALCAVLDRVSALHPGVVLQGDVLFIGEGLDASSLVRETINGIQCFTFQPNTIRYAVPVLSRLGARVAAAGVGLALHTTYVGTGESLAAYSAQPLSPETFASLRQTPDVLCLDAARDVVSGTVAFSAEEHADFVLALDKAVSLASGAITFQVDTSILGTYLPRFLNACVRKGLVLNPLEYVNELFNFLDACQEQEAAARKTAAGTNRVVERFTDMILTLTPLRPSLEQWFRLYLALTRAKHIVLSKLALLQTDILTFLPGPDGLTPTGPEGFVVQVGHKVVKLVDRRVFSRSNFARLS